MNKANNTDNWVLKGKLKLKCLELKLWDLDHTLVWKQGLLFMWVLNAAFLAGVCTFKTTASLHTITARSGCL